ncbi:proliferating cell nuclear antigen (pcna) [Methanonatronarchaeum sp. AMET6-2]|uniref:proliferating cell nuclear antigen (pcna) n=1 Tax=Methanonatronarchaeum sp. AMET6-2 TaxID=2933293 RepID=UPI001203FBB3|nr:proliferating cell nuclear antigen (pcna) [Methanonatronarchaeum sp. AMET6-2]RZN62597.1 MAG: proliferating cell nuclear antigen (pcna) [Methanonatronarchaeia archaeon]UOY09409.1 proliferating cell nuclear antigen (pcna) [Methanonatronarchaeum sp. AMET6-2]
MAFKASIKTGKLKEAFDAVGRLVDEIKLKVTEDGLNTKAVDPANVAMSILSIPKEEFETYEQDEEMTIGIDLNRIDDILSLASNEDILNIHTEDGSMMNITVSGFEYDISLIDPSTIRKEPNIPDLDLPAEIVLNGKRIQRAIKATEKISDYIVISTENDSLIIKGEGDTDSVKIDIPKEDLIKIDADENARSLFSLDYLSDMSKSLQKAPEVTMHLGTDYPIMFKFNIAGSNIEYLLAPRIESE